MPRRQICTLGSFGVTEMHAGASRVSLATWTSGDMHAGNPLQCGVTHVNEA